LIWIFKKTFDQYTFDVKTSLKIPKRVIIIYVKELLLYNVVHSIYSRNFAWDVHSVVTYRVLSNYKGYFTDLFSLILLAWYINFSRHHVFLLLAIMTVWWFKLLLNMLFLFIYRYLMVISLQNDISCIQKTQAINIFVFCRRWYHFLIQFVYYLTL
jgi:hypothetical protein